jgi:glycine C-acetyltransferase
MSTSPMREMARVLRQNGLVRFFEHFASLYPDIHLKNLVIDTMGPHREMTVNGHSLINFGSDSFLGLDQHPRVKEALIRGTEKWGTHNGASRAFCSVAVNEEAERKLAAWLGTEDSLIYPSVTLANMGAIPGLVGRNDLLIIDEQAHNSMQEGAKIAKTNGANVRPFSHCDPTDLVRAFHSADRYRCAMVAIDGVYSMTGALPPLQELNEVCLRHNAVLYIDDAHGTGVIGGNGRGTVLQSLGSYDNTFVVGSLSKAFSCMGGFIGCSRDFKLLLKMRSNTYIFGGPVPPPYLEAICVVCDILCSSEYQYLQDQLQRNLQRLTRGCHALGLHVTGGQSPILSILVGDEADTLRAGRILFEKGYYVQSVTFPAVPYHAGVLRIQVNSNHHPESIDGLLTALASLRAQIALPNGSEPLAA